MSEQAPRETQGQGKQGRGRTQAGPGEKGERIAKVMARSGLCSRRDAERLIEEGRVALNGTRLATPAITVGPNDRIEVDGATLVARERTRLWLFHKPRGLVTTNRDPEGRPTVFSVLPKSIPRVMTVGRLDINTEGLLLLTNDGGLARLLELPSTGWLRRYRVRANGKVDEAALVPLRQGISIDGMVYGAIEAEIERVQGANVWLSVALREGKNREVKRILEHLGLVVNRLIRISYGPFQLGDLTEGDVREIRGRVLRDQLGEKLASAAGADFEAPLREAEEQGQGTRAGGARPPPRGARPGKAAQSERPGAKPARGSKAEREPDEPRTRKRAAPPRPPGETRNADRGPAPPGKPSKPPRGKSDRPSRAHRRRPA